MRISKVILAGTLAALIFATTPGVAQTFAPPPPPRMIAPLPPPPGRNYAQRPGYYRWTGYRYVWVGPSWVVRPPRYTRWVPGRWQVGAYGRWRWVPGRWA